MLTEQAFSSHQKTDWLVQNTKLMELKTMLIPQDLLNSAAN